MAVCLAPSATVGMYHMCMNAYVCGCVWNQDTLGATQGANALEQWAQALESHPSDRARVHGANQAPGTCSQATVLVC